MIQYTHIKKASKAPNLQACILMKPRHKVQLLFRSFSNYTTIQQTHQIRRKVIHHTTTPKQVANSLLIKIFVDRFWCCFAAVTILTHPNCIRSDGVQELSVATVQSSTCPNQIGKASTFKDLLATTVGSTGNLGQGNIDSKS